MQEILVTIYLISIILYWVFSYIDIKKMLKDNDIFMITVSDMLIEYFLSFIPIWNTIIVVCEIYIKYLKNTFEEILQTDITKFFK